MSEITPLMTSLHEGHKTEERLKCIDDMLFKKCEDTKDTILQAFWWYRKNSIPLDRVDEAREKIDELDGEFLTIYDGTNKLGSGKYVYIDDVLDILDKLIESEDK